MVNLLFSRPWFCDVYDLSSTKTHCFIFLSSGAVRTLKTMPTNNFKKVCLSISDVKQIYFYIFQIRQDICSWDFKNLLSFMLNYFYWVFVLI